jgi:PTH1 family peptidyl-tRNA hydrolase
MYCLVGLGNPGKEYEKTRHNVGFRVIDYIAGAHSVTLGRNRFRAVFGRGEIANQTCVLVKPQTFMNNSGDAVRRVAVFYKVPAEQVLVILDDMDLELGQIRLRAKGSDGGHKGLRSIVAHAGTDELPRLRLGVGRPAPGQEAMDYVLAEFRPHEREKAEEMIHNAAQAVEFYLSYGIEAAMNRYN